MAVAFPLHLQPAHWIAFLPASKAGMLGQHKGRNRNIGRGNPGAAGRGLSSSPIWTHDALGKPQQITYPFRPHFFHPLSMGFGPGNCWDPSQLPNSFGGFSSFWLSMWLWTCWASAAYFVNQESWYLSWSSLWVDEWIWEDVKYKCL